MFFFISAECYKGGLDMSDTLNIISGGTTVFVLILTLPRLLTEYELTTTQRRALILYVAGGALQESLAALREARLPETAAMFILACHEIHAEIVGNLGITDEESSPKDKLYLPGLDPQNEDVITVGEYFGQYQRKLVHLCMDTQPFFD